MSSGGGRKRSSSGRLTRPLQDFGENEEEAAVFCSCSAAEEEPGSTEGAGTHWFVAAA